MLPLTATGEIALPQTDQPYSLLHYCCSSVVSGQLTHLKKQNNKVVAPNAQTLDERRMKTKKVDHRIEDSRTRQKEDTSTGG